MPTGLARPVENLRDTATKRQWDPAKGYLVDAVRAAKQIAYHDVEDSAGKMHLAWR